jgi:hypothetical protein
MILVGMLISPTNISPIIASYAIDIAKFAQIDMIQLVLNAQPAIISGTMNPDAATSAMRLLIQGRTEVSLSIPSQALRLKHVHFVMLDVDFARILRHSATNAKVLIIYWTISWPVQPDSIVLYALTAVSPLQDVELMTKLASRRVQLSSISQFSKQMQHYIQPSLTRQLPQFPLH